MTSHQPPTNPPSDWPLDQNGAPVPANANGDPCGNCKQGRACPHAKDGYDHKDHNPGAPRFQGQATLNPDIIARAKTKIQNGDHVEDVWADPDINIPERTWYAWLEKGIQHVENDKDTLFADFLQAIARAETRARLAFDRDLRKGARGEKDVSVRDLIEYLKRRWPDRYSTKRILQHQDPDGEAASFEIQVTTSDDEGEEEEVEA